MDRELVYLTNGSPPASPKTPTATVVRTSVGSSSGPALMQNQHQPWPSPEQQPQPLPKRLRASSEPTMDTQNHNQSPPAPLRHVRSSSENNITRSGKQPIFNNYRLQGTMSKVQLTEAEHELLMRQKESSNPKTPVNCMSRADDTGSSLMPELLDPTMIGPGAHIPSVGSSSSSKKALNVVSQVAPGEWRSLLNMLSESPVHKQISQVPTSVATPAPISSPPVSAPPTQALLASASVQSPSLASSPIVSTHPISASHAATSLVPASLVSAPPVPDPHVSAQSMPTSLASAPPLLPPVAIAPPVPTPIVSTPPMPAHIASAPPVLAPLVMTLPVRAPLLSTPFVPAPLASFPPILAPLESAPAVSAPPLLTASERHIPETLRLFPVETPFFPMKSERGSSSRAGKGDTDVDLSVYRDDSVIKPGDMNWTVAMPAANPIVEYEQDVAIVPHNGGHRGNVVLDVNLDLSL